MTTIVAVCTSGRFVSRGTFVVIALLSLVVLAPTSAEMSLAHRLLVGAIAAVAVAILWAMVGVLERHLTRVARGGVVVTALLVTSIFRPGLQDAVSHALALAVPPAGAEFLRMATNLAAWSIALIATAALVDAARATRETNATLRAVLAHLRGGAERAREFEIAAAATVSQATALLRAPLPSGDLRERAAAVRSAAHRLAHLAAGIPAPAAPSPTMPPSARGGLRARLPIPGSVTLVYAIAVIPFALRSVALADLAVGLAATAASGFLAEIVPRMPRWRRDPHRALRVFVVTTATAGIVLALIAVAQGLSWGTAVVPALVFPAVALGLAGWRGGAYALTVERRRLSAAITACVRADDLSTRQVRTGLRAAAEIVHRDAQGVLVRATLQSPGPDTASLAPFRAGPPTERSAVPSAELTAELTAAADAAERAFRSPATSRGSLSLDALLATWSRAMPIESAVSPAAGATLDADAALAADAIDIVAEGLLNAAKHARTRAARVSLDVVSSAAGPYLRVQVRSPGPVPREAVLRPDARAALLGARLAATPEGTALTADLALQPPFVVSTEHSPSAEEAPA